MNQTPIDAELLPAVLELVQTYGKDVTYVVPVGASFDAETSTKAGGDEELYDLKVTPPEDWTDQRGGKSYTNKVGASNTSLSRGFKCYLPAKDLRFTPSKFNKVRMDGLEYKIEEVGRVYSGNFVVLYILYLRA